MSFWNTDRLKKECEEQGLVTPYREERVLRCAYELGVGTEAFITSKSQETTHLPPGQKVGIPPGQFGLLITNEVVYVPDTAIAFISIRAGIKFQGLVNVSGFHVDPGYRGHLKFAVYNAGSKEIVLDQDERVFMIWYADLDGKSPDPYPPKPETETIITSKDVDKLKGEVASPAELKTQIDETRVDVDKKIHAVEQSLSFNRWMIAAVFGAVFTLVIGTIVKPYLDRANVAAPRAAAQVDETSPPSASSIPSVVVLPAHVGVFILLGCAIVAASVVGA